MFPISWFVEEDSTLMTAAGLLSVACSVRVSVACDHVALVICTVSAGKTEIVLLPADVPPGAKPPAYEADAMAVDAVETPFAWAVKEPMLDPAGMVTVVGTFSALALVEVSEIAKAT